VEEMLATSRGLFRDIKGRALAWFIAAIFPYAVHCAAFVRVQWPSGGDARTPDDQLMSGADSNPPAFSSDGCEAAFLPRLSCRPRIESGFRVEKVVVKDTAHS
jgi:hypothetical protein